MVASIPLTGLAANDPIPGEYAEISFAQGAASSGTNTYPVLLIGNKTSAGSATADTVIYGPDTPVSFTSETDAIALAGTGSELHKMIRRFLAVNTTSPLYFIAVSEGGSNTIATGTITVATNATSGGVLRIYVGDEFVDTGIVSGDTPTTIATNAIAQVNAKTHWAATATNSAGVITLTSRQGGLRGNFIRYFAQILPSGIGTTVTPVASTVFTGGGVSDSNVTALATILAKRFYYIVSAAQDGTQVGALLSQVNTQALPVNGIRQRVFAGSLDTVSNGNTVAIALNGARAEVIWQVQSDWSPGEIAANAAAVYSLEEAPLIPRLNFSSYGNDSDTSTHWKVKAPLSGAAPTRSQILSALNNGLTPIAVNTNGSTYLVKRITTRSLSGSVVDYRIRDAHKVTVCDRFTDDLVTKVSLTLRGKLIGNDPVGNAPVPGPNVVTPRVLKTSINRLVRDYGEDDLLQNVATIILQTQAIRETSPSTRLSARIPLQPIDILDQIALKVDQVG